VPSWPVTDPADDQPDGDVQVLVRLGGEGRIFSLRDLGVGDPAAELVIPDGLRVLDGLPGVWGMAAIAARMAEFTGAVTENRALPRRIAAAA
jgi:hypothetical protein